MKTTSISLPFFRILFVALSISIFFSLSLHGQGNTCADAQVISSLPFIETNKTTCGKVANYTAFCGLASGDSGGEDFIYTFTATSNGCLKIDLTNTVGSSGITDVTMAFTEGCPGAVGTVCDASIAGKDGDNLTIKVLLVAGKTYFLTIDAESGECLTSFDIKVDYMTCPTLPPLATNPGGVDCGSNLGFESGDVSGWSGLYNDMTSKYTGPPINPPIVGFKPAVPPINGTLGGCNQATTPASSNNTATPRHTLTNGAGADPNTNNLLTLVAPGGGTYSLRLGNQESWNGADCIQRTITPTAASSIFTYLYAIVSNDDPDHPENVKARFEMSLKDPNGATLACGGLYRVTSGARLMEGFVETKSPPCGATGNVWYSPWRAVSVDLSAYIGQNLTIKFCASDCSGGAHYSYAYIDAYCGAPAIKGTTLCTTGGSVTLTAPIGFANYKWYSGGFPVTGSPIGTNPTLTISNPVNGTIYTVTYDNIQQGLCATGSSHTTDTIKVFNASARTDTTICTSATGNFKLGATSNDPGTVYTWSPATNLSCATCQNPVVTLPLSATTTYTVTATSPLGCSMTDDVIVNVISTGCGFTATATSATVCPGACATITATANGGIQPYIYSWSPATGLSPTTGASVTACPASTTTYTVIVTDNNGNGTTAIAISVVTVNSSLSVTVPPATICAGNSTTLTASGATTYTWSPSTALSATTGTTVTANPTTTTTYTVVGTTNGCTGSTTVVVTVNQIPNVTVGNVSICTGGSTPLTASGATIYTWSLGTGLSSTTGTTVTANPTTTTTYTVVGTTSGCTGSTTVVVSVGALVPNAGSNATICPGGSATLNASGGSGYNWIPATGLSNPAIFNPVANPSATTTYTVTVTSGSCTGTASVIVTVETNPTITVAPASICLGNSATLTASGASTYTWTPATSLSAGTGTTVTANPTITTTYTVTGTSAGGCTGSITVIVTVTPGPTINGTGGITCAGVPISVTASGADTYTWVPATGLNASTGSTVLAGPSTSTTYTVTGTSTTSGCTGTTTVVVTILPSPIADFTISPASPVAPNTVVTFTDASTNVGSSLWNFGDTLSGINNTSTSLSPTHTYTNEGDYCITLTSTNTSSGCADTITKCIVIGETIIRYPNVFTPNGDGNNDIFYFYTKGFTGIKCTIYDRWGLEMYEWDAVKGGWDGRAKNGKPAPDGVYYFIMEATPANGEVIPKQGFLQLLQQ